VGCFSGGSVHQRLGRKGKVSALKTVLLIDDEQGFLEALADALESEGHRVLKARDAKTGLDLLARNHVDLVAIDIMLDPGGFEGNQIKSTETGLHLCKEIRRRYPLLDAFCVSVYNDTEIMKQVQPLRMRFLSKGETPLRTVLNMINSRLTGVAYSSDRERRTPWER
jgi:CheY-like chemotaxis protein